MPTSVAGSGPARGDRTAEVAAVVRAFALAQNAVLSYGPDHPVVTRTIQEQMPLLDQILGELRELTLVFGNQQVLWNDAPLDAGNALIQKFAQQFALKGITAISLLSGLTGEEVRRFFVLLKSAADQLPTVGLQAVLERDGIRNLREVKVERTVQRVTGDRSGGADSSGAVGTRTVVSGISAGGVATVTTRPPPSRPPAASPGGRTVGSDAGRGLASGAESAAGASGKRSPVRTESSIVGVKPVASKGAGGSGGGSGTKAADIAGFQEFVKDVLTEVSWRATTPVVGAERITAEYSQRLTQKVDEVRQQTARQIRCLENIRDVMLTEMDNLKVPAILLDANHGVVEANDAARALIGKMARFEAGSPLHTFLISGRERALVDVGGTRRTAHRLLSSGSDAASAVVLLALE